MVRGLTLRRSGGIFRRASGVADGGGSETNHKRYGKMVKHIILWQLKEDVADKAAVKAGIKAGLEGLKGRIPGLLDIHVRTEGLASSNADVMLDSSFADAAALKGSAVHPEHVKVADAKVRPFTKTRLCLDFEE